MLDEMPSPRVMEYRRRKEKEEREEQRRKYLEFWEKHEQLDPNLGHFVMPPYCPPPERKIEENESRFAFVMGLIVFGIPLFVVALSMLGL